MENNKTELSVNTEVLEKMAEIAAKEVEGVAGLSKKAMDIKDELNPELKLAVVKMSNKKHPSKIVKTSIDSANAVMNIDTPEVKGYTIEDLLSLTKYLVSKEIGPEDNRILEIVIEKLTEAQMWYGIQNK